MRSNLAGHRRRANARMRATVTIRRPGEVTTDPTNGNVAGAGTIVYNGPARWKAPTTTATETETGTAIVTTTRGAVSIPIDNPDGYSPRPGDIVECTADPDHPALVGQKVRVAARFEGDDLTAYRIPIEA